MTDPATHEALLEVRQDRTDPRLLDLWLRVALARSYGPPVNEPLPEALRHLLDDI
jgi:hypothetical protein